MNMNRPQYPAPSRRPLEFKLPSFEEDKRLAFVDSVCRALMTSRFGDGAMYTLNPRFRGTADEPFNFLHLLGEAAVGWHDAATFPGRKREYHLRKRVAMRIGQVALINGHGASFRSLGRAGPTLNPPAHARGSPFARGSPNTYGTFFFASSFANFASFAWEKKNISRKAAKNAKGRKEDAKKTQRNPGTCNRRSQTTELAL